MPVIFGIDPGFSGALALLIDGELRWVEDMPTLPGPKGKTELNHLALFNLMRSSSLGPADVWIEQVGAMPGQGVSSMFRFGQQVGSLQMAIAAAGHRRFDVTPAKWKQHFGLSRDKGVARGLAQRRFPTAAHMFDRVKDDGRAEAALIALYGWEKRNN